MPGCKVYGYPPILTKLEELRNDGYRVIAIAQKTITKKGKYTWNDAKDLTPLGAKPDSGMIAEAGKGDALLRGLKSKERTAN